MRVFVTGSTGFLGSAIVRELKGAGHQVLGLVRSEARAKALASLGATPHRGDLEDVESLQRGASACDGVIHTAFNHDFVNVPREVAAASDRRAIEAMGDVLAGTHRPLIMTAALGLRGDGRIYTEADVPAPETGTAHRLASENAALALVARGVRAMVVRLPPTVHGDGDYAFVPMLIALAREKKLSAYIGEGANRWAAVHRLDAAHLYRRALESGTAGARYHGVAEEGVPTRAIAEVIGRHANVPVASKSGEDAQAHFGWLGRFFALDMAASSARTRESLGWAARHVTLLEDLERGTYFR